MYNHGEELMENTQRSAELILRAGGEIYKPGNPWIQICPDEETSERAENPTRRAPVHSAEIERGAQIRKVGKCQRALAIFHNRGTLYRTASTPAHHQPPPHYRSHKRIFLHGVWRLMLYFFLRVAPIQLRWCFLRGT